RHLPQNGQATGARAGAVTMNQWTIKPVPADWNSSLPVYASAAFLRSVGSEYGWIEGNDSAGSRGMWPYTIVRKPGLKMVRFRVETIPLSGNLGEPEEKLFLQAAVEYFRRQGADMIIPSGNTALFRTYPESSQAAPYGTYVNDLTL